MKRVYKRNDKIAYFELMKLKFSRDEKRGMKRVVVRQVGRMRMRERMGQK
jgi:hypothetical protein